jgi:hypothetical protein
VRRGLAAMLVAITLSACAPAVRVPSVGTGASTASTPAKPTMDCLGGVPQSTCDQVLPVALAAVASSGWTPTHVWINSGFFCPQASCLFDPNQTFPMPQPPSGGQWIANAEIAFAEADKHAGLHVAQVGSGLVPVLIGYRVPLPDWCSGACPASSVTDGSFRLELSLPHLDWKAGEVITGMALLAYAGSAPTTIYGSGSGVIAFSYAEVEGTRHVEPVWTADCGPHPLDPATPINADLSTSGAVDPNDPNADFLRSFLGDRQVRLPAGTWDITAVAMFSEAAGCSGGSHTMKAVERITVTE